MINATLTPYQVRKDMFKRITFLQQAGIERCKCGNCGIQFKDLEDEFVGYSLFKDKDDKLHRFELCQKCCDIIITKGAKDCTANKAGNTDALQFMIAEIVRINNNYVHKDIEGQGRYSRNIHKEEYSEIEKFYNKMIELEKNEIAAEMEYVETPLEDYLVKDYGFVEFEKLKHHTQIGRFVERKYFDDFFEDSEDGYIDELTVKLKIGNKYYDLKLEAEFWKEETNSGAEIYVFQDIMDFSYTEIEKPLPLSRKDAVIELLNITDRQLEAIKEYLTENNISYK